MKRFRIGFIFIVIVMFVFSGCQSVPEKYSLVLMLEDSTVYKLYDSLDKEEVALPVLEEEGRIFLGWNDGIDTYYNSYIVKENVILTVQFENVNDVFDIEINSENRSAKVTGYSGEATDLKIPQTINGYHVTTIGEEAFLQSSIVRVGIPLSVNAINHYAFKDAIHLREVYFYGQVKGQTIRYISRDTLEDLLTEQMDVCLVDDVSGDGMVTYYQSGCPIASSELYEINTYNEIEYYTYKVYYDLQYAPYMTNFQIYPYAFSGASALETLHIPAGLRYISYTYFEDVPNLKTIIVDPDNAYMSVVDGVIYSKDLKRLLYYPTGLADLSFTVPDFVEYISLDAFVNNDVLEEIVIGEDLIFDNYYFTGMQALKRFVVDENNPYFYTLDGVLYAYQVDSNIGGDILVAYPNGLEETSYTLPEGVTDIGHRAFMNNHSLTNIDFSDHLEAIGHEAFYGMSGLSVVDIPRSIQYIGNNILGSSSVQSMVIRRSVEDGDLPIMEFNLINMDYMTYPTLYLPDDSIDAYGLAFKLKKMIEYVKPLSEYVPAGTGE